MKAFAERFFAMAGSLGVAAIGAYAHQPDWALLAFVIILVVFVGWLFLRGDLQARREANRVQNEIKKGGRLASRKKNRAKGQKKPAKPRKR